MLKEGLPLIVDFVVGDAQSSEWKLVLVEQGPWAEIEEHLKALQERLYDCLDAALDGQVAEKFPASKGKPLVIQVDCYNLPEDKIRPFFEDFSNGVFNLPDYQGGRNGTQFVGPISFEISFDAIH
jgi:hypothetical protein